MKYGTRNAPEKTGQSSKVEGWEVGQMGVNSDEKSGLCQGTTQLKCQKDVKGQMLETGQLMTNGLDFVRQSEGQADNQKRSKIKGQREKQANVKKCQILRKCLDCSQSQQE